MSPKTFESHTIIRSADDAPYPGGMRLLVALTLIINIVLLAIRAGRLLAIVDPHRRYQTIGGSSLAGTSLTALILMQYGIPILLLLTLGIVLWRDDGRVAAILYAIAAFVAIPFLFARYFGRDLANYPVSLLLHVVTAFWLLASGLIAVAYIRRLRRFGRSSRVTMMMETTTEMRSDNGG